MALGFVRSSYYYRSKKDDQAFLRKRIREISLTRFRYGYRRVHILLKREGWKINHKRVYRLYCQEDLQMRLKPPKRRVSCSIRCGRSEATKRNHIWSMDFVSDQLYNGRKLRFLTIVDNFTRLNPLIRTRFHYKAVDVVKTLDEAIAEHGVPEAIQVDNARIYFKGTRFMGLCQ